ncbi:MAG: M48 family metalloprotease, partial [Phycisphaerales bacterium]|nr:M48 family metalloprotease [Phycisphaerales bacterium]
MMPGGSESGRITPTRRKVSRHDLARRLVDAVRGEIPPRPAAPLYILGMVVVGAAVLCLPALYLAAIGAVGTLTVLHATHDLGVLSGQGMRGRVIIYVLPILAGAALVVTMLKPLFARRRQAPYTSLNPRDEPTLFAFVHAVADVVGAPRPRRIDITCDPNAAAAYRRGLLSLFGGRDLILVIGLPLVAGMNTRQFAGVLAHEFGHFTQGAGMRMTYLIRSIHHWLARVVYERDAWDDAIARICTGGFGIFGLGVQLTVWLARRILWVLMVVSEAISGFMLRQMEFDADRCETLFAGSDAFASTVERLQQLAAGAHLSAMELPERARERRLPDDLPAMMVGLA